jgi:hypothetical protein
MNHRVSRPPVRQEIVVRLASRFHLNRADFIPLIATMLCRLTISSAVRHFFIAPPSSLADFWRTSPDNRVSLQP